MANCLRPGCGDPVYQRGLCKVDHGNASNLVTNGVVTWEALEEAGKSLPFTRTGPKNPSKDWLLDGVEKDGCGRLIREVVEGDIVAGVPPLELWETRLRGWSKGGVTKSIRSALARLRARGVDPTCRCGRAYVDHATAAPCASFAKPEVDVPPPAPPPNAKVQPPPVPPAEIERMVRMGIPPKEIETVLRVTPGAIIDASKRVRAAGHEMWCRCKRKPWGHRDPCDAQPAAGY